MLIFFVSLHKNAASTDKMYFHNNSGLVCIRGLRFPSAGAACGMSCCSGCLFHELTGWVGVWWGWEGFVCPLALAELTLNATAPSQTGGQLHPTFMTSVGPFQDGWGGV